MAKYKNCLEKDKSRKCHKRGCLLYVVKEAAIQPKINFGKGEYR